MYDAYKLYKCLENISRYFIVTQLEFHYNVDFSPVHKHIIPYLGAAFTTTFGEIWLL